MSQLVRRSQSPSPSLSQPGDSKPCSSSSASSSSTLSNRSAATSISTSTSATCSPAHSSNPSPLAHKQAEPSQASQPETGLPHDIFTITDQALAAQYTFEKEIGFGNWGSIWLVSTNTILQAGKARRPNKLAIKLVHRDKSSNTTPARIKSLWSEFKILRNFKADPHPNVLRVSSFIITPSYALLTMSHHPALLPVRLPEHAPRTRRYIRGLLSGAAFLHANGVSHNDIKPANVVLSCDDEPVLIDFGFAVAYGPDHELETGKRPFWSTLSWGTPEYLSPQRAKGEPHDERLSDIWSLGVTIYEVVIGRTPFEATETEEFLTKPALEVYYQRTLKAEFLGPHTLSAPLRALLIHMLTPSPSARLNSCAAALAHPFFLVPQRSSSSRLSGAPGSIVSKRIQQLGLEPVGGRPKQDALPPASAESCARPTEPTSVASCTSNAKRAAPVTPAPTPIATSKSSAKRTAPTTPTRSASTCASVALAARTPTAADRRVARPCGAAAVGRTPPRLALASRATKQVNASVQTPPRLVLASRSTNTPTPTATRQKRVPVPRSDTDVRSPLKATWTVGSRGDGVDGRRSPGSGGVGLVSGMDGLGGKRRTGCGAGKEN